MATKVLVTGAAGFVGAHIVRELLDNTDWTIYANDCLTYAGRCDRIGGLSQERVKFLFHDFRKPFSAAALDELKGVRYVIHNGAETHVLRSLIDPVPFINSNIIGTQNVLEAARALLPEKFIYVSTDEVFGATTADAAAFRETDTLNPSNPYSATKAAGEMIVEAYHHSFGVPAVITRTMNMFGEMQHPEKFVPLALKKIINRQTLQIHATAAGEVGTRHWLHARNQANALLFLLEHGNVGEAYHVAGTPLSNFEMATIIAGYAGESLNYELLDVFSHAAGHDLHYGIDGTKLQELGWVAPLSFHDSLKRTVEWTIQNQRWLDE